MSNNQKSLSAFNTENASTGSSQKVQSTRSLSRTSTSVSSETPLSDIYADVRNYISNIYPREIRDGKFQTPIEPADLKYRTRELPDGISALPESIGNWKLAIYDDRHFSYKADGPAYDERWGSGGALCRVRVYLNDRGANKDGLYHRSNEVAVGFENGAQIRDATIEGEGPIVGLKGHSPTNNRGDYATLSGTAHKTGTPRDAAIDLLAHLHYNPVPLRNYLPTDPNAEWSVTKEQPLKTIWEADAPQCLTKQKIKLYVSGNRLSLTAFDEGDSLPDQDISPAPFLETFTDETSREFIKGSDHAATAPAITIASKILTTDLEAVVRASDLEVVD